MWSKSGRQTSATDSTCTVAEYVFVLTTGGRATWSYNQAYMVLFVQRLELSYSMIKPLHLRCACKYIHTPGRLGGTLCRYSTYAQVLYIRSYYDPRAVSKPPRL